MYKLAVAVASVFFAFIIWIIYLADTGSSSVFFYFVRSFPYGDKLGHSCLFGALTLFAILATRFRTLPVGSLSIYYGAAMVVLFVLCEEVSQAFISTRTFDLLDLLADILGILVAVWAAQLTTKYLTICST